MDVTTEFENAVKEVDAELRTGTATLQATLADKGEFAKLCDEVYDTRGRVPDAITLAKMLSEMSERMQTVDVDLDEAQDMFIPNLTRHEFSHLAHEYFSSLCSALDLTDDENFERQFEAMSAVLKSIPKP